MKSSILLNEKSPDPGVAASLAKKASGAAPEVAQKAALGCPGMGHHLANVSAHSPKAFLASPVRLQPKLVINQPGDAHEQEADAMADKVMRMPAGGPGSTRLRPADALPTRSQGMPTKPKESTQRKEAGNFPVPAVSPAVAEVLRSAGQPLDGATRLFMEQRFGYDFGKIQIHDDAFAHRSAKDLNARAYTHGQHVVFGLGQYEPVTDVGRTLLAHELTHVLQQTAASAPRSRPNSGAAFSSRAREQHPFENGYHGREPAAISSGPVRIARQPAPPSASPLTIPSEGVDMPWVGKGGTYSSELGYLRDASFFWRTFRTTYPAQLSPANQALVANDRAPVVDATWVQFHPEHASYMGDVLEHHHVGQGSRAVPLPSGLHDAQTVFHPQRRVVSTPQGGTRPLPARPTRAQAQEEIDRHVEEGRIRGPGISPQATPRAPAVPPASEVAGTQVAPPRPRVAPPQGHGEGDGMHVAIAAGVGELIGVIITMVGNYYLQKYFAGQIQKEAQEMIDKAIRDFDFDGVIKENLAQIKTAQTAGLDVSLNVSVDTSWQSTDIGTVLVSAQVGDCQVVYENGPAPKPHTHKGPGGGIGDALRMQIGTTLDAESFTIPLGGTDPVAKSHRQSRTVIDRLLQLPAGQPAKFEELITRSYYEDLSRDDLGDYARYKRGLAEAANDKAAVTYWNKMQVLVYGPLADVITQAKIKSIPLDKLKAYAQQQAEAAGQGGDAGAGAHAGAYWAGVVSQIEGPLPDRYLGDQQRFSWTQPGSKQEIDAQKAKITGLESRLAELAKLAPELLTTDARTKEELRGGEPPHPPWSRMEANRKEISKLKEDIWIEKKLLVDLEKGLPPRK